MVDYGALRIIWWLLLGMLLTGFAIMDGFDLGIGILLPYVSRNNLERRIILNTIGPIWEGNQIWLILGAGAIFAAWPLVYSVAFSGFYFAMLLVLLALILRPLGFKYRNKINNQIWRNCWDIGLFLAGFIPSLIFGVALGNVLQGVPFNFDDTLRIYYTGSFLSLLNPFALCCGFVSVAMLSMHGASFLSIKTDGVLQQRAQLAARISGLGFIILFAVSGFWVARFIAGYQLASLVSPNGFSNPLYKHVTMDVGIWLANYSKHPFWVIAPLLGFVGAILTIALSLLHIYKCAWVASSFSIIGTIATVGLSMYPFILPSSSNPELSLLIWDASSSQMTLLIMLLATVIFMPLIIAYTSWVYYVLRGKVTADYIIENDKQLY